MKTTLVLIFLSSFSVRAQINLEELTSLKKSVRDQIMGNSFSITNKSMPLSNDRAEDFVENPSKMIFNLEKMESLKLTSRAVSKTPWSDSYWPIAEGMIAYRYNDPEMGDESWLWTDYQDYYKSNPTSNLIEDKMFDYLSPAEKYDYVLGLSKNNLTQFSWNVGQQYQAQDNKVESWMGICHGWSIASIMMPNPVKKVIVNSSQNEAITFYPSDIKALGSLLWAQSNFPTRFIGGRCNEEKPAVDSLGRPKNPDCLDDNPATWHLAVVNEIGIFNRSFVMDTTYNYEVWNQPVYSYQYFYNNVATKKRVKNLAEALVPVGEYRDGLKSVRAPGTKYIVGVTMFVKYVSENEPSITENQDTTFTDITLKYELELDANKNIIGGEWKSKLHPDFIWTADVSAFPATVGDSQVAKIDLKNISPVVKKFAVVNAKSGVPFAPFVKELFKQSSSK